MATFEARADAAKDMNRMFQELRYSVEKAVEQGEDTIDVVQAAESAGIHASVDDLARYGVPQRIISHPFLPWDAWFPWEALWSAHLQRAHPELAGFIPGTVGKLGSRVAIAAGPMP